MKILLLGASGRLGNAFSRNRTMETLLTPSRAELDVASEAVLDDYLKINRPDWIINLISHNAVDRAEKEERDLAYELNAKIPERVARTANEFQIPMIHFSTDYVFPGEKPEGYTENDEPWPLNVYGTSKLAGERAVLREHPKACIVRTSRLYGPMATSANAKKSFIDHIIFDCKRYRRFGVNLKEVASPTLVDDVAKQTYSLIRANVPVGIYHLANSGGCTLFEWASEIIRQLNLPNELWKKDPAAFNRPALRPEYNILLSTKSPALRPWPEALTEFLSTRKNIRAEVLAANPQVDEPRV